MAKHNDVEALKVIVEKIKEDQGRIDLIDNCGWTALHITAVYGCVKAYDYLVSAGSAKDRKDWNQNNPLHLACTFNRPEMVKHLLEEETISVDDQDEGSATAILKAAYSGNVEIAQMLINRKCFISAEDKDGNNALLVAAMRNHTELALLVIKYGIDVSCVNQSGDKFEYFF